MRLNGTIVTGLFKYIKGLNFTANDLILYNLNLYVVLCDYDGNITPDKAEGFCVPYVEYHSYDLTNGDESKFITPKSLMQLINSYFKGLTDNQHIQSIRHSDISELDQYTDTGAYDLLLESEMDIIPSGRYLFRIYKTNDNTYQEIADFTSGLIYVRSIDQSAFNILANDSSKVIELNKKVQYVGTKLKSLVSRANSVLNNSFNFVSTEFTRVGGNKYTVNDVSVNKIIHLIILEQGSVEDIQYPLEFYISSDGMITKQYIVNEDLVRVHFHGSQLDIELSNPRHVLINTYISKGRTDE